MGVNSCDRAGCSNVMCGRLSHTHGYICNECFAELIEFGTASAMPIRDIVPDFMHRNKTPGEGPAREFVANYMNQTFPLTS